MRPWRFLRLRDIAHSLRKEWAKVRERYVRNRAIRLIRRSGLFDDAWYLKENPDVATSGIDPARHYLLHGWLEGRNPSPLFDGQEYLARHPELFAQGINPLVHHLKGKWQSKAERPVNRPYESADVATFFVGSHSSTERLSPWRGEAVHRTATEGTVPYLFGEAIVGHAVPGTPPMTRLARHIHWMHSLAGTKRATETGTGPGSLIDGERLFQGDILSFGEQDAPRFMDVWFDNSHALRVRLEADRDGKVFGIVTAMQWDPVHSRAVVSEASVGHSGMTFLDVRLANRFLPVLFVFTTPTGDLRTSALMPFPSLGRGGIHHGEALSEQAGLGAIASIRDVSSRLAAAWAASGGNAGLDWIEVDPVGGIGAERLFASDLRMWLGTVMGVGMRPADRRGVDEHPGAVWLQEAVRQPPRLKAPTQRVIKLTPDAVPSLHALYGAGRIAEGLASFVVCRGSEGLPAWLVHPPAIDVPLESFQPFGSSPFPRLIGPPGSHAVCRVRTPAAIRFTNRSPGHASDLQSPFAQEMPLDHVLPGVVVMRGSRSNVTALLSYGPDDELFTARLQALALQTDVSWERIVVVGTRTQRSVATDQLKRWFPSLGEFLGYGPEMSMHAAFNEAAAMARGEYMLVLGGDVLLHDHRTVASLAALHTPGRIASSACMLIGAGTGAKGEQIDVVGCGCHASASATPRANHSERRLADSLVSLPPATWPVRANAIDLFMVRREEWLTLGGFEAAVNGTGDLVTGYWDRAGDLGRPHLVTTALSATVIRRGAAAASPSDETSHDDGRSVSFRRIVA